MLSSQYGVLAAHIKVVQLVASEDAEGNVCTSVINYLCVCLYHTLCMLFQCQYVHR